MRDSYRLLVDAHFCEGTRSRTGTLRTNMLQKQKSTGLSSRASEFHAAAGWRPQRGTNYSAESVLPQAVPPALKRMTPDWSEQNARLPLWPFALGTASEV